MSQLDDRVRRAATGLHDAVADLPVPVSPATESASLRRPARRRALVAAAAACVVGLVVLVTFTASWLARDPQTATPAAQGPATSFLAPLLPPDLMLPAGWRAIRGTTTAVVHGPGAVSEVVVWRPTSVVDPKTGDLGPAPYAMSSYFYADPRLDVRSIGTELLGGRKFAAVSIRVTAAAPACGRSRCAALTVDGSRRLTLVSGHAVKGFMGTAYGEPLVVLVVSTDTRLDGAVRAAQPVLDQLRWGALPSP